MCSDGCISEEELTKMLADATGVTVEEIKKKSENIRIESPPYKR